MSYGYTLFLIFVLFFSISIKSIAATGPEVIPELKEKVYFNTTPEKPNTGDNVQITAEMYGTDVKDANFQWKLDGKIFKEAVGANKLDFILSNKARIDLKITTGAGVVIDKSFEFNPKKIVLIWESKTYTPPFYKGKSLFTPESLLVLNAINLDQENPLTNTYNNYSWSLDGNVKGSDSGVGYSTYSYQGNLLMSEPSFEVVVSGIRSFKDKQSKETDTYDNQTTLNVQTFPTEILSYEKSPLLGVLFNKTVKPNYTMTKSETTLVGYPLYYGLSSSLSGVYSWLINDVKINNNLNQLSFKKKTSNEKSRLTLEIKNKDSILQTRDVTYIIDTSN